MREEYLTGDAGNDQLDRKTYPPEYFAELEGDYAPPAGDPRHFRKPSGAAVDPASIRGYLPCVAVLVWNDKKQLPVVSRKDKPHLVCLPGGKAEDGKDGDLKSDDPAVFYAALRRAAVRELFEESGLVADPADLELIFSTHDYEKKKCHTFAWFARKWTGELRPEEGSTVRWNDPAILTDPKATPWADYYSKLFEIIGLRLDIPDRA